MTEKENMINKIRKLFDKMDCPAVAILQTVP